MKQEEFSRIFLKYKSNRSTADECRGAELGYKNWQSPKDTVELVKIESQIFENFIITINTTGVGGETVEMKTGCVVVFPKEPKSNSAAKYDATTTPNLPMEYNKWRKELVSPMLRHPRMVPLVGVYVKTSTSNEIASLGMSYEVPVLEILNLKAVGEVYKVKIVFDQNKLSSCLLTINLKSEDGFTRLQVSPRHWPFLSSGRHYGSS